MKTKISGKNVFKDNAGFSLTELIFVVTITVLALTAIVGAWIYTYKAWTGQREKTYLRVDMLKGLENLRNDVRLSSRTGMAFYPSGVDTYTAISMPEADVDVNGFYTMNASNKINWNKTVIYFIYTPPGGKPELRRTLISSRDNTLTDAQRYTELQNVVTGVSQGTSHKTIIKGIDTFEIGSLSSVVDFYDESATAIEVGKIMIGRVKLTSGTHTIAFKVTGKNAASSGYKIGIDTLFIEPCGSYREAEYFNCAHAPSGALTLTAGSTSTVHDSVWNNNNYLEYNPGTINNSITFKDDYDLWRESSFDNALINNMTVTENEKALQLEEIANTAGMTGSTSWLAYSGTGDTQEEGHDGTLPGGATPPIAIRTVIPQSQITAKGDFVRVCFKSHSGHPITINAAYITKRNGTSGYNGLANADTGGGTSDLADYAPYHRHQQLFFDNGSGGAVANVTIPANSEVWCMWTAFPLSKTGDYFISFSVPNAADLTCRYWAGSDATVRTYYVLGANSAATAGTPDWSAKTVSSSKDIFVTSDLNVWNKDGTVESQIFDTTLDDPVFHQLKWWQEATSSFLKVTFKARSSDNDDMTGATAWSAITGSGTTPYTLSIGTGRYVQFYAAVTGYPYWKSTGSSVTYNNYVHQQISLAVYTFPSDGGGNLHTAVTNSKIDDIAIDWPGEDTICTLTADIARRNDYGQASVTVDGADLTKVLNFKIKLVGSILGEEVENTVEVEPRNTGR